MILPRTSPSSTPSAAYKPTRARSWKSAPRSAPTPNLRTRTSRPAVENAEVDIPEAMVENQIDSMMRDMEMRMMYQGMRRGLPE